MSETATAPWGGRPVLAALRNRSVRRELAADGVLTVVAAVAGATMAGWPGAVAGLALGLGFAVVALVCASQRYREVAALGARLDEVLHSGRRLAFESCQEGDVAVLANEVEKAVARLVRTTYELAAEKGRLAETLADISHQVRTPLTTVSLLADALVHEEDPAERRRLGRELESLVDRVNWLVTALLQLAKADAGALPLERAPVNVGALVVRAAEPLDVAFDLAGVTLAVDVPEDCTFLGDARWCAEALENLLKDCLESTPAGGRVTVEARETALATTVDVTDTGPGFSEKALVHLFERFWRGGGSERRELPWGEGFGIGLTLAKALVEAQGGTLSASNAPDGGARFTMAFPRTAV